MAEKMPLNLEPMERGDNALDDQLFDILHDAVQPDGRASLESQIQKITQLLPEGKPYSYGVSAFLATCYEIAEQIPYDHPSLSKLVTIIDLVLSSSRFPRTDNTDNVQTDTRYRYQKVGETLRDWWDTNDPSEHPSKYVSFQTFAARIYERGVVKGSHLAIWVLQAALEEKRKLVGQEGEAYVMAASQWILIHGEQVYREAVAGGEPGPALPWKSSSQDLTLRKWRHWREQLHAVASGKRDGKAFVFGRECKGLADRATEAMFALERKKVEEF